MDFLNKHYEKLILLAVLIVFFIGMIFVLNTLEQTKDVKPEDLNIEIKSADYQGTAKSEANIAEQWKKGNFAWNRGEMRKSFKVQACYSDLVQFVQLANCPGNNCGKLIPRSYFSEKKCPDCGFLLKTPPKRPKYRRNEITPDDSDGDGMPDTYEDKFSLNKSDHMDAQYDKDGDGFSNYYEMTMNTDPTKSRIHPPLWRRLRLYAVARVVLPVSFRALMDNNSNDVKDWDAQFNVETVNRRTGKVRMTTRMLKVGDEIRIDNRNYRLEKIDRRKRAKTQEELAAENTDKKAGKKDDKFVDESIAYLTEMIAGDSKNAPDKLEMQVGKTAYSSDRRPIFVDDGLLPDEREKEENRRAYAPGQKFTMGNRFIGQETYVIHSFDDKAKTVVLHRAKVKAKENPELDIRGVKMIITSEGGIPEDARIIPVVEKSAVVSENSEI